MSQSMFSLSNSNAISELPDLVLCSSVPIATFQRVI